MSENFLLRKNVDRSLLERGFAIPAAIQTVLSLNLRGGTLKHGEKRAIKIILNGATFEATLTSVNFDEKKYPNHRDIWQIVYPQNSRIANAVRKIFSSSAKIFQKNLPPAEQEYFALYTTNKKDCFLFEPVLNREIKIPLYNEQTLENLLELPTLTDIDAALLEKYHLTKIRKLNRSIGKYLKELYNFSCQICGKNFGTGYGVNIVECHHIDYFVESLNNDAANLLIVCPNHHSIIHAAEPIFNRKKKIYQYPNGYKEGLQLNLHL